MPSSLQRRRISACCIASPQKKMLANTLITSNLLGFEHFLKSLAGRITFHAMTCCGKFRSAVEERDKNSHESAWRKPSERSNVLVSDQILFLMAWKIDFVLFVEQMRCWFLLLEQTQFIEIQFQFSQKFTMHDQSNVKGAQHQTNSFFLILFSRPHQQHQAELGHQPTCQEWGGGHYSHYICSVC